MPSPSYFIISKSYYNNNKQTNKQLNLSLGLPLEVQGFSNGDKTFCYLSIKQYILSLQGRKFFARPKTLDEKKKTQTTQIHKQYMI